MRELVFYYRFSRRTLRVLTWRSLRDNLFRVTVTLPKNLDHTCHYTHMQNAPNQTKL
jgi:hypothetical protein